MPHKILSWAWPVTIRTNHRSGNLSPTKCFFADYIVSYNSSEVAFPINFSFIDEKTAQVSFQRKLILLVYPGFEPRYTAVKVYPQ